MASNLKILISHRIPPAGPSEHDGLRAALLAELPDACITVAKTPNSTGEAVDSADILLASGMSTETLNAATSLKWVQSLHAGVGQFPIDETEERGVVLTSGAGIHAQAVAETVLGYALLFERGILHGLDHQGESVWKRYETSELGEKTVGIVGVGTVGGRIAELCGSVGSTVLGTRRNPDTGHETVDEMYLPDELQTLASRADYVIVSCPLTDKTRGLFGEDEFLSMKHSGVLVNVARGPIIDHSALVSAIQEGRIRGAALDVTDPEPLPSDSPLWSMPEVVVTPHVSGGTDQYWRRGAELFAKNYRTFVDGRLDEMTNRVT
jgi:phosphoglycerate dehydrogenase-like enzyme